MYGKIVGKVSVRLILENSNESVYIKAVSFFKYYDIFLVEYNMK